MPDDAGQPPRDPARAQPNTASSPASYQLISPAVAAVGSEAEAQLQAADTALDTEEPHPKEPSSLEVAPTAADALKLERRLIFFVGAVQFANVLDFMMVMPMGPDFADALDIPTSHIGLVGGAYTASAAVAGIVCSLFLDRFDRRKALTWAMLGLALGTAAGGLAWDLGSLLIARVLAGAFGGPATSLSLAIVTDSVPAARRGKALGSVMAAFSLASVLGVPAGLELARLWGFRAPFFSLAGLSLLITLAATRLMPPMVEHLKRARPKGFLPTFDRLTMISLSNTALTMVGVFAVVPNLSAFVQHNMGYPRDQLGMLYLFGGIASFISMRVVGVLVDRWGPVPLVVLGTLFHLLALEFFFIHPLSWMPILLIFTLYMLSGSVRMVPMQTLATQVPQADQRARFMSAQSAVQHMASALGAFIGSVFLIAQPDGALLGMDNIAWGALVVACIVPFLVTSLHRGLKAREAQNTPLL